MLAPEALRRKVMLGPAPQYSAPALPDQMSAATPRPGPSLPLLFGVAKIRAPLLAERRSAPSWLLDSWMSQISRPAREVSKSPTCKASPWPRPEAYIRVPLSLTVAEPKMISWRPSLSTSAIDRL